MEPSATLGIAEEEISEGMHSEALRTLHAYFEWVFKGGTTNSRQNKKALSLLENIADAMDGEFPEDESE